MTKEEEAKQLWDIWVEAHRKYKEDIFLYGTGLLKFMDEYPYIKHIPLEEWLPCPRL
jgi:hypothetical protein